MKRLLQLTVLICFVVSIFSTASAYTFRPQWVPQTQFAGYYLAAEKGFYKKAGIEVKINDGGPGLVGLREVAAGETDFATGWLISALRLKAKGEKLVLIGQVLQKSALLLIAKKTTGIKSVKEFSGHSLGVWPGDFQLPPKALVRKYRVGNVKIINQGFSVDPFIKGEIDVASAMKYNEYHQIIHTGMKPGDLIVFDYSELGMNLPEDGIYVSEDFYKKNQAACKKFVEASMEGWKYAFNHKDEAVKLMTRLANQTDFKTTEAHQRLMLDEIEKLMDVNSTSLKMDDFKTAIGVLKSARIIKKDIDYNAFTNAQ